MMPCLFLSRRFYLKNNTVSVKDRCRLYCRVETTSAYYLLKDKVIDGTSCGPDTDDICVNGVCKQASCRHILGRKDQLGTTITAVIDGPSYYFLILFSLFVFWQIFAVSAVVTTRLVSSSAAATIALNTAITR